MSKDYSGLARNMLYYKSFKIASDYFPLGAGLGRYASYLSALFYSPLYYEYGLYLIRGLSPERPNFITDTFWPMILGETGFLGLAFYFLIIILIFKNQFERYQLSQNSFIKSFQLAVLLVWIKALVESVADPFLTAPPQALFLLGALGVAVSLNRFSLDSKLLN